LGCWGESILQKPWECLENLLRMLGKNPRKDFSQYLLRTKNPKFWLYLSFVAELFKSLWHVFFLGNISTFLFFGLASRMSKNVPTTSSSSMALGCPQQVSQHSWLLTECGFCLDVSKPKHRYLMYVYPLGRNVVLMLLMLVILPWTLGDFEPTTIWHHHHGQLWTMPDFIRMIKKPFGTTQ